MSDALPGTSDPALNAAVRAVARSTDAEAALEELLRIAGESLGAPRAAVFLWDGPSEALRVGAAVGIEDDEMEAYSRAAADRSGAIASAAHDRQAVLGASDPVQAGFALCAWPIVVTGAGVEEPIGCLALSRPGPWAVPPADTDRGAALADLVGLLVDRSRLIVDAQERGEWRERVANSDSLTGLANARTLARVVELELARASRQASELCIAVFDVDGLGAINERAGMAVGDAVLREVAAVIAESVRLVDTVAREGRDEFVLIAPGATGPGVVRRIVGSVAARPPIGGLAFTVSAGVAHFPVDGTTSEALMAAARGALDEARAAGPGTIAEPVRTPATG